jgi:DNA-binding NarL/FixJ family response regulator
MRDDEHIRVVIVDDHPMVRLGICTMLLSVDDIVVVGEASNGEEALRVCARVHPDVVLMDLLLPELDGPAAIRALCTLHPAPQVLVLSTFADEHLVREALEAGARGYLQKDVAIDDLIAGIQAVHQGQLTLAPAVMDAFVRSVTSQTASAPSASTAPLTQREMEVLVLVASGLRNREIAHRLVVAPTTVKYHIQRLFAKLGVSSRTELVALAIQRHLVELSSG